MADATANRVGDENCMVFGFGGHSSRATKIAHPLQIYRATDLQALQLEL